MESTTPFVRAGLDTLASGNSKHVKFTGDEWFIGKFRKDEVQFKPGRNLNNEIEKYQAERLSDKLSGKTTTFEPVQEVYTDNVILNIGMQESIDRDIGVSSTDLDYASLGTSSTAEAITQTDLQTELTDAAYARKQYSVSGSRSRTLQTRIMAILWDDSSLDSPPETIREAGIHWHLSDALKCHARAVFSDFILDAGDTLVIRTTELQTNGVL